MQQAEDLLFQSYHRAQPYLDGYDQLTRDLTPMRQLFDAARIPLDLAPAVTVTGSKGKGSTAILTAALLEGMGHRVGLLTSPHLIHLRERIRVNGRVIPEAAFVDIVNDLAPHLLAIERQLPPNKYLSPTGLFLALALRYFASQGVTAMVLETGRGGRFDDVRLAHNRVACFTPMMAEHLDKLGPTLADVAWHKVGIIPANGFAVSAPQVHDVRRVITAEAAMRRTTLRWVGEDVLYESDGQAVAVTLARSGHVERFTLRSHARYQALNLAVAYGAATALDAMGATRADIGQRVAAVHLPGRCDLISRLPYVIVDGAINEQSAAQFLASARSISPRPIVLVTALPTDKDADGLLETLMPHVTHTIITRVSASHLHFDQRVADKARALSPHVSDEPNVASAFTLAVDLAGAHGTVWVVGTQSLVRDALTHWHQNLDDLYAEREML